MSELIKYLIEQLKKRPITAEALLIAAILCVVFLVYQYFTTKSEAIALLQTCYIQATIIIGISIWVASLCWRCTKIHTLRIITTLMVLAVGIAGAIVVIRSSHIEQFKVRIVFDESVDMSPYVMAKLIGLLQSQLLHVEIQDKALQISTSSEGKITDDEVRSGLAAHELLSSTKEPNQTLVILITGNLLEDHNWSNLLMISWDDAIVISTWNVGATGSLSDVVVRRYVATSVVVQSVVANALKRKKAILENRSPDLYRGCLHDFHRTRQTYVIQSQKPVLCKAEAEAIKKIYGAATVKAVNSIFNQIAGDG